MTKEYPLKLPNTQETSKQSGRTFKTAVVSASDQTTRIQGAIARRAFVRAGASIPGYEFEEWRKAESERPVFR
jgi:hypothetical protein